MSNDKDEKLLDVVPVVILNNRINQLLTKIDELEKLLENLLENLEPKLLIAGNNRVNIVKGD